MSYILRLERTRLISRWQRCINGTRIHAFYKFDLNHHGDGRYHPDSRTLHRRAHQRIESKTFHGMQASTIGDAADVPLFGGQVDFRRMVPEPERKSRTLTIPFTGQRSRETSQGRSTRDSYSKELAATCKSSSPGSPRVVRHLRLRRRSAANRPLDSRLSILAEVHWFQSKELGIDSDRMEAIGTSLPRTCRGSPTGHRYHRARGQRGLGVH